ncbi:hypothetical protein ACW4YW_04140 [Methylobacillus pratensis]
MIGLLNILPLFIVVATITAMIRLKQKKVSFFLGGSALVFYIIFQPSYFPKGEVVRAPLPEFEASSMDIQDRNKKPVPLDEKDKVMAEKIRNGLEFKSK